MNVSTVLKGLHLHDSKIKENEINLNFNENLKTSVLKVPAFGSFGLVSPEFIVKANPDNVVISSGKEKKRFNSDVFVKSLEEIGIEVIKISDKGAVIFESDGEETHRVDWN